MASLALLFSCLLALLFLVSQVSAVKVWNSGAGRVYKLHVTQDVTLESPNRNYNSLPFLLVGKHPQYPNKRSLVQFENLPSSCPLHRIRWAKMYVYYVYSHKASWHSVHRTPFITRYLNVHLVKKSWNERHATSSYRYIYRYRYGWRRYPWSKQYLSLDGRDAERRPQSGVVPIYTSRPHGWIQFDVSRAVRSWRRGVRNYGLLIRATNEYARGRGTRFASNADRNRKRHAFINVLC